MLVGFQTLSLLMVQLHTCSTLAYLWVRPGMILQLSYFGQQNLSLYTYRKVFLTWNHNNWLKTKQTKNPCQTETKYYYARYGCRQTGFSVWLACPRKSPPPLPPPPPPLFSLPMFAVIKVPVWKISITMNDMIHPDKKQTQTYFGIQVTDQYYHKVQWINSNLI